MFTKPSFGLSKSVSVLGRQLSRSSSISAPSAPSAACLLWSSFTLLVHQTIKML
jgi:hypothetical protein